MKELSTEEILVISGGKPRISKLFGSALWGGLFGGIVGFIAGGPVGAVVGAQQGAIAASLAITAKEGGEGLAELLHPEVYGNQ